MQTQNRLNTSLIRHLGDQLQSADAVMIGAGAGLSAAAGFTYEGERFASHFADFEARYGFHDMYSGGFYPYKTQEEHWAYWSRYIQVNRYTNAPKPVYDMLFSLVEDKDHFVLTTNVDHCFQKAGFQKERLFYTQGDYGLFQCSDPCCQRTWDNKEQVSLMVAHQKDMRVPTELIPRCPFCGKPATMNLRSDARFVQDAGWDAANERYERFVTAHQREKVLYLELGVGYNTPGIIKFNFWRQTYENPKATYACLNLNFAECAREIEPQAICIKGDIFDSLQCLNSCFIC